MHDVLVHCIIQGVPSCIPVVAPLMAMFSIKRISSSWLLTNFVWFCTLYFHQYISMNYNVYEMHSEHTYKFLWQNIQKPINLCLMFQEKWTQVSFVYMLWSLKTNNTNSIKTIIIKDTDTASNIIVKLFCPKGSMCLLTRKHGYDV